MASKWPLKNLKTMNHKNKSGNHGLGKRSEYKIFLILIMLIVAILSCSKGNIDPTTDPDITDPEENIDPDPTPEEEFDESKFYRPEELKDMDLTDSSSKWCYKRSKQSDHFIVFWEVGYGNDNPGSTAVPEEYRVDIDDLLTNAEMFYDVYINKLKFAEIGVGKSRLDNYKMLIFLFYTKDWMAFGAGYDNVIGACWVSPSTCHPVGHTIAHEIGHSFQFQVFCDLGGGAGFRDGPAGAFWEQTAQYQANQCYPDAVFGANLVNYCNNYHRQITHEHMRYDSYFIHYYWTDKHGADFIGRLWRESIKPEDPIQAYMRITGITTEQLNDEVYDQAAKFVTWDIDELRELGANHIGKQTYKLDLLDDGSYQVNYDRCPETTGYNVIPLNVPDAGTEITTQFTGIVNAEGFNQVADPSRAGWRYGYVALLENGSRVYGDMHSGTSGEAKFTIPSGCAKLWFVVTAAPTSYTIHVWDEDNSNDEQWPYQVKFTNTNLLGNVTFDGTEVPADITQTFDVKFPASSTSYDGVTVEIDKMQLAKAFVIQSSEIGSRIGNDINFYAVEPSGTLNATTTAGGDYGHWFDRDGKVCSYSDQAKIYSEFTKNSISFKIGQFPGHCISGNMFRIKQALVYTYAPGKKVQATFVFNITIE